MMAYERSGKAGHSFGKFIHQYTYQETWKDLNKIL